MIDVKKLKCTLIENGVTQKDMAEKLQLCESTWYSRIKNDSFTRQEIEILMNVLTFSVDPVEIFFKGVQPKVTERRNEKEYLDVEHYLNTLR